MQRYTEAKYVTINPELGNLYISVLINGVPAGVPICPGNSDYDNIMKLVAAGELVILPAE
jgi:hypothetical protein